MRERTSSLWIVALVAFAGMFHFLPATNTPNQTTPNPGALRSSGSYETALRLLADHYLIACQEQPITKPDSCITEEKALEEFRKSNGKVLLALVPDPIDARGTYKFDEAIEALRAGAQNAEYLLDRFTLPWPRGEQKPADKEGTEDPPRFRLEPGVLVFRKVVDSVDSPSGFSDELLVMLVIGETPTRGIQKSALLSALRQSQELSNGQSEIRIVGPQFSGSASSIEAVLKEWSQTLKNRTVTIHFISANATNPEARRRIKNIKAGGLAVDFHATALPDDVIDEAMAAHFRKMGIDASAIAILAESDSAYGQKILAPSLSIKGLNRYRLPYPMHVSQVQTRYQEEH